MVGFFLLCVRIMIHGPTLKLSHRSCGGWLRRLVRYFDYWISASKRKIYSSVSSPLPLAKSLFSSIILKSHFCNTLIDLLLSFAALCEKWPMGNFLKQLFEGLSCDSLAPVFFST